MGWWDPLLYLLLLCDSLVHILRVNAVRMWKGFDSVILRICCRSSARRFVNDGISGIVVPLKCKLLWEWWEGGF